MSVITDYDELRTPTESLDLIPERRAVADVGEEEETAAPGFEIIDEELIAPVVPVQADEFRCGTCFLVLHRTLHYSNGICRDCA